MSCLLKNIVQCHRKTTFSDVILRNSAARASIATADVHSNFTTACMVSESFLRMRYTKIIENLPIFDALFQKPKVDFFEGHAV